MNDELARKRFFVIQAVRIAGAVQVLLALLVINQRLDWPAWIGYLLFANGFIDVFLVPILLAKRWRTPRP